MATDNFSEIPTNSELSNEIVKTRRELTCKEGVLWNSRVFIKGQRYSFKQNQLTYTWTVLVDPCDWTPIPEYVIEKFFTSVDFNDSEKINHPPHYNAHPSGVEVIAITEHMDFCLGNAVKYIMRCEHKGNKLEDLKKAAWYINREIERLEKC